MKTCSKCKVPQDLSQFGLDNNTKDKKTCWCKSCQKAYASSPYAHELQAKARERRGQSYNTNWLLLDKYGINLDQKRDLFFKQNMECSICFNDINLFSCHTDHDHKTNIVRGLLCSNCNRGIGHLQESIQILSNAVSYLS